MKIIDRLSDGPLDIVGDVHGQIGALEDLLKHLGYATDGVHPEGRRLVFVGDLVDRGPDSPGVVELVQEMVAAGNAQCVLGNHELNILRGERKHGNDWFFEETGGRRKGQKAATGRQRAGISRFIGSLPLALEREDLRVVHACWHADSISRMQDDAPAHSTAADAYERYRAATDEGLKSNGLWQRYRDEQDDFGHLIHYGDNPPATHWPDARLLPAHAEVEEARQMANPVAVLTSGAERRAARTYPVGGRFRFVDRLPWWEEYRDDKAVIVGHYWRVFDHGGIERPRTALADVFNGARPDEWLGKARKVYCVDFSVAGRAHGHSAKVCRLGAVRWPESVVVFDDGEEIRSNMDRSPGRA